MPHQGNIEIYLLFITQLIASLGSVLLLFYSESKQNHIETIFFIQRK